MNTSEIHHCLVIIAREYLKKRKKRLFHTVCACDMLPTIPKHQDVAIVVNTQQATESGEHWQAIWITSNTKTKKRIAYFFDTYGRSPTNSYISDFLSKNCERTFHNKRILQSKDSLLCGEYCCIFLQTVALTGKSSCFMKMMGKDRDLNDNWVCLYWETRDLQSNSKKIHYCIQICMSYNECMNKN